MNAYERKQVATVLSSKDPIPVQVYRWVITMRSIWKKTNVRKTVVNQSQSLNK